jgi:nucleotide-binding universal stress UspA family protein
MRNNKYKILVLSDLKKSPSTILKSTVSLAKMIDGDINFFHVKKPSDVVERESQLSAMRAINQEQIITGKKIQEALAPISNDYNVNINSTFAFGNVKNEIEEHIKVTNPDVIVLGKRKAKGLRFLGDNITNFVLKIHKGPVMIASNKNGFAPDKELHLGLFNDNEKSFDLEFTEDLIAQTKRPLKSFNIIKNTNVIKEKEDSVSTKTVDFVFEKNDNTIKNLSNYLLKNDINLLCVNRQKDKSNVLKSEIKDVIDNVNISLFITNKELKLAQ